MRIAVAGSSGFIGRALLPRLRADGHEVLLLTRRAVAGPDEIAWDPASETVDLDALDGVDALVNLAGAGIADHRWSQTYKQVLYASHVNAARTLATAAAQVSAQPSVLISVGAMGYYGNATAGDPLTEDSPPGKDFAAMVVIDKEQATSVAADAGVRVVLPRLSLVMGPDGGTLGRRLLPLAKAGVLGPLAGGRTVWSVVSVHDVVRALVHLLIDESAEGPFNVSAPQATTNEEFTKLLGAALHRPTLLPVPRFGLRLVLGEFAEDVLADFNVVPDRLVASGFAFDHPDAASIIDWAVGPSS